MSTSKSGSGSQITGYRYRMSVHMGVGRGPVNELTEIRVGDLIAWSGAMTVSDFQPINQPNLFGGDQKEGGIVGTFKLFMGAADQVVDTIITDNIEGGYPVPGWRGVTSLFYYGQISSNNPYPKPWKLRVNRQTAGWDGDPWHPELALISMQSTPLTLITFNVQPQSGDGIGIGDSVVSFFTYVDLPGPYVVIGATVEETASRFAAVCNTHSATLDNVTASASGITVTLTFPVAVTVYPSRGAFATIGNHGGGIKAMNPAHIIYECATNNVWGRGLPRSFIDETSFLAAAQQLGTEGFGLCLRWNRQEDIDRFVAEVVNHIGAAVFIDRVTGLLKLNLIRADYDPSALPIFTFENGILDIIEDESSAADTAYNEIIVGYVNPISGGKAQVRLQNLASFQSLGTLISTTIDYPGLPTAELAARVAQRDLQANSADVRRLKIKFDRTGFRFGPADVFRISVPSRGISNMILRIGQIDEGPIDDNTITITAVQDVFSLPATSFIKPQPSYWTPPDRSARVIFERLVGEMTYVDAAGNLPPAELAALTTDTGIIKIFAEHPGGSAQDYVVASRTTAEAGAFIERNIAGFDAGAELAAPLGLHDTAAVFTSGSFMHLVGSGIPILLVRAGDEVVQEYCRLDAINLTTGAMTIARGCIDTVPHSFAIGDKIWFQTASPTTDFRDYASSETVLVKLLTRTSSQQLDAALAETDTVDMGGRQGRPYPPGDLFVGGAPFEESLLATGEQTMTWAHRDRITQGNFLLEHPMASTGPEAGTTYNIRVYDGVDDTPTTLIRTVSGITGTSFTYTNGMDVADGQLPIYWFTLESVRDTLPSWQRYEFRMYRDSGFNDDFDENFDGGPP